MKGPVRKEDIPVKIISVTGAHSNVGKTSLCSILLKMLSGYGAVKFTKTALLTSLTYDKKILREEGKDTALFLQSGAEKVLWIQSPYNELEDVLMLAIGRMRGLKGVIIEGNSPVDFLNPHLIIFIIGNDGKIKASAEKVSKKADIVIINTNKQTLGPSFPAVIGRKGARVFRIDLEHRKGELNEFLRFVKEKINTSSH
ncbi:MAG: hypothetical protein HY758_09010 [Nitrospirae bacterium]|nr:hypothetical protein [Nitrospirota bacterium]